MNPLLVNHDMATHILYQMFEYNYEDYRLITLAALPTFTAVLHSGPQGHFRTHEVVNIGIEKREKFDKKKVLAEIGRELGTKFPMTLIHIKRVEVVEHKMLETWMASIVLHRENVLL